MDAPVGLLPEQLYISDVILRHKSKLTSWNGIKQSRESLTRALSLPVGQDFFERLRVETLRISRAFNQGTRLDIQDAQGSSIEVGELILGT